MVVSTDDRAWLLKTIQRLDIIVPEHPLNSSHDITACGESVQRLLVKCASELRRRVQHALDDRLDHSNLIVNHEAGSKTSDTLQTLVALAKEFIDSIPFNVVPRCWLRLYTDATLLWSFSDLLTEVGVTGQYKARSFWLDMVRRLDMTIIIAGAIGNERMMWVQDVMQTIQCTKLRPHAPSRPEEHVQPLKRARIDSRPGDSDQLFYAPSPIPVLKRPPSITRYLDQARERPFILRGYFSDSNDTSLAWPALNKWSSASYLLGVAGEGRVVPVEIGGSYNDSEWGQKIIPFRQFLHRAGFKDIPGESEHQDNSVGLDVEQEGGRRSRFDATATDMPAQPLYLAQYSLFDQFPGLARDFSYPDYVWSDPAPPSASPEYQPPATEDGVIVNVWVGSGSGEIISPAHTDPFYNCYAQVLGHKRVWLAPPHCTPHMASYGPSTKCDDEQIDGIADMYMTNTSRVPLLRPVDNFQDFIREKHPDFFESVWPCSMEAVLFPGDLLIMPPQWWHAMRGEGHGPGWSVSMWY